jgi:hypothetical protein
MPRTDAPRADDSSRTCCLRAVIFPINLDAHTILSLPGPWLRGTRAGTAGSTVQPVMAMETPGRSGSLPRRIRVTSPTMYAFEMSLVLAGPTYVRPSGTRPVWRCDAARVSHQDSENVSDGGFPGARFGQRQVCLDLVTVASTVFLLHDVAGLCEIADDGVGASFGNAKPCRDVTQPYARVVRDGQQGASVVGQETPVGHTYRVCESPEMHCLFLTAHVPKRQHNCQVPIPVRSRIPAAPATSGSASGQWLRLGAPTAAGN